jgi:hypothetical protein
MASKVRFKWLLERMHNRHRACARGDPCAANSGEGGVEESRFANRLPRVGRGRERRAGRWRAPNHRRPSDQSQNRTPAWRRRWPDEKKGQRWQSPNCVRWRSIDDSPVEVRVQTAALHDTPPNARPATIPRQAQTLPATQSMQRRLQTAGPFVDWPASRSRPGDFDAQLFGKLLTDLFGQSVMHPTCTLFGRIQHRDGYGRRHRHP